MFTALATTLMLIPNTNPVVRELNASAHFLQPAIPEELSGALSRSLYYYGVMHNEDPFILLAMAFQESSLDPLARSVTEDVGLFQFSPEILDDYKVDRRRLHNDLQYQVNQAFVILRDKRGVCNGPHSWACWHSQTPKYRELYTKEVLKYYRPLPIWSIDSKRVVKPKRLRWK